VKTAAAYVTASVGNELMQLEGNSGVVRQREAQGFQFSKFEGSRQSLKMISVCLQVLQYLKQHKLGDEYDIRVG
jgi:hypothetical protein